MRILFVSGDDYNDVKFGGGKGAYNRHKLLKSLGDVYEVNVKKRSLIDSFISVLEGFFPPMDRKYYNEIMGIIQEEKIDTIFFDSSTFGLVIKRLKKISDVKIISHFNNCEYDYQDVRFGQKNTIKKRVYKKLCYFNEKLCMQHSDVSIALSARDSSRLAQIYRLNPTITIPLFAFDEVKAGDLVNVKNGYCLLFGPVGNANVEGFSWFVKNVSPYICVRTIIAGNGFEKYSKDFNSDKVEVVGYVKDIHDLYRDACCVCIPIFSGGGMKLKTIEALMFGKNVIGTDEAFSGYEFDYDKAGGLANDAETFINRIEAILNCNKPSYNEYSRNIYLEKYSGYKAKEIFMSLLH